MLSTSLVLHARLLRSIDARLMDTNSARYVVTIELNYPESLPHDQLQGRSMDI